MKPVYQLRNTLTSIPSIGSANASLSTLADIEKSLVNLSDIHSSAGAISLDKLNLVNVANIQNIQQIAGTPVWQEIANNVADSSLINVVGDIQRINIQEADYNKPKSIIPQKIVEELKVVRDQKSDKAYKFPAYKYIFNLEVVLRKFITDYVIKPNIKQLASKIPQTMLDDWEDKKTKEEGNRHIDHIIYELIEYSDFTDLKIILEKTTTITLLRQIIKEDDLKTITSKLIELEPLRLKIAHSRALTRHEFETLKFYSDKIKKILP